jgi:YD repeat-containing protein
MRRWLPFILLLLAASAFAYAPAPTGVLPRTEFLAGNQRTPTYGDIGITQLDVGPDSSPLTVLRRAFDEYGRVTHFTNVNSVVTTNGYDLLDRLVLRHLVGGTNQVFQYTTRGLTNVTDELGHVTRYLNDALGRTTSVTNANNEGLAFAYNPLGQLLSLKDGKNQETKWNYNQYGQVTNKVDATGREIFRYRYDAAGQLTNRWSAQMGDTFYRYDNLGQLTNVDYPAGMADVTLQYDGLGRLTNAVDGGTKTHLAHPLYWERGINEMRVAVDRPLISGVARSVLAFRSAGTMQLKTSRGGRR